MQLSQDASSSQSDIRVQQFFIDVLNDYAEFMPSSDESIMDSAVSTFAGQIEATDEGRSTLFVKTGTKDYSGYFEFDDLEALADQHSSLSFYCSIDNYTELASIVPFLADPNISVYLAQYNIGYSEQDYMDMITFAIGEEAPDALRSSMITINVTVPGTITAIEGAEQTGPDSLSYSFPLIDFLLLAEPLAFSVQWS